MRNWLKNPDTGTETWVSTRKKFARNSRVVLAIDGNNHETYTQYDGLGRGQQVLAQTPARWAAANALPSGVASGNCRLVALVATAVAFLTMPSSARRLMWSTAVS